MALDKERLSKVSDEDMELIFRIARLGMEIEGGEGNFERILEKSTSDIDSIFALVDEVIHDGLEPV